MLNPYAPPSIPHSSESREPERGNDRPYLFAVLLVMMVPGLVLLFASLS